MSDDEEVFICDECQDIFLSRSGLEEHMKEEHTVKQSPVTEKTEITSAGKRSRSPSKERHQNEVKKKKVKMGPASRVKRDRSSSEEREGPAVKNTVISNILDSLASTESDGDKLAEKETHQKHKKHKDRDKHRDRDGDKDREKEREKHRHRDGEKRKEKKKDKERDRERDKNREKERKRVNGNEELRKRREAQLFDSSDDEEINRKRSEKAKAEWKRKDDFSKGKEAKYKSNGNSMDGFIVDDNQKSKKSAYRNESSKLEEKLEKKLVDAGGGFASQGTVKAHDNETGPECFKCGQICKDNSNLKNHVLSHYYQVFYDVLPDSKPFPCPLCESTSRDRITLVRHFAFTHKKLFEMTDVTPEHIAGFGNRKSVVRRKESVPSTSLVKRNPSEKINKIDYSKIVDSDSGEEDVENRIKQMKSKYLKVSDGESRNGEHRKDHKKHKKHKHKDHKDHKSKKEKKHKKDKHRDREEAPTVNPLGSLLKDLSPDSSTSGRSQSRVPPEGGRSEPEVSREGTPVEELLKSKGNSPNDQQEAEESDDLLDDDFATPVFA